jgi:hypothetical protein
MSDDRTSQLQDLLDLANRGDGVALRELIGQAYNRLRRLASKMLCQDYPRLGNLHGTDSVANRASVRLLEALEEVRPPTVADFFRLAAARIRCILLEVASMARKRGPRPHRSSEKRPRGNAPWYRSRR